MSTLACFFWWFVLGALLGLLASWLLGRRFRRPTVETVERVVEKRVEKLVDNPAHLARIKQLEGETGEIARMRGRIKELEAAPAKFVEKVVEKPIDNPEQVARIRALEAEISRLKRGPEIDLHAAKAAGFSLKGPDDLKIVEGIGPKIEELLQAAGIRTFRQLADSTPEAIRTILDKAGPDYRVADPGTWPRQAGLAAVNYWQELALLQAFLTGGRQG